MRMFFRLLRIFSDMKAIRRGRVPQRLIRRTAIRRIKFLVCSNTLCLEPVLYFI
jgi:hypothetical protein